MERYHLYTERIKMCADKNGNTVKNTCIWMTHFYFNLPLIQAKQLPTPLETKVCLGLSGRSLAPYSLTADGRKA